MKMSEFLMTEQDVPSKNLGWSCRVFDWIGPTRDTIQTIFGSRGRVGSGTASGEERKAVSWNLTDENSA